LFFKQHDHAVILYTQLEPSFPHRREPTFVLPPATFDGIGLLANLDPRLRGDDVLVARA